MRAIIERLSMRTKMQLVALLALAAAGVPGTLLVWEHWTAWRTTSFHLLALSPAARLAELAQLAQRHRGLAHGYLSGNATVAAEREAAANAWQAAWPAAEAAVTPLSDKGLRQALGDLKEQSQALLQAVRAGSVRVDESFERHSALVDRLVTLQYDVAVTSQLVLHPEAAGYFLQDAVMRQMPPVVEGLARLRGSGMGLLARKEASPVDRERLQALMAATRRQAQSAERALAFALKDEPALRAQLERPAADAAKGLNEGIAYVEDRLLRAETLSESPERWWTRLSGLIDQQYQLSARVRTALEEDLAEYAVRVKWRLIGAVAVVLALLTACMLLVAAVAQQVGSALRMAVQQAEAVSRGDLTGRLQVRGSDEVARMLRALDGMTRQLSKTVHAVRDNAAQVASASSQIAQGNQDLSERTERQASNLQQTAASIEELGSTVTQTAQHAHEAHVLASSARDVATRGGEVVGEVVQTLRDIGASSQRIADIVVTIDGIAFQTNILALNAAVEAARAGEQGRGFAVVAGEVRALAQRSSAASREIRDLIGSSVERMERGTGQADRAAGTMHEIVEAIERFTGLVAAISEASREQSSGVRQAGVALSDIDNTTQQNAALVEESAAAAESLRRQAQALQAAVGAFHVLEGGAGATAG